MQTYRTRAIEALNENDQMKKFNAITDLITEMKVLPRTCEIMNLILACYLGYFSYDRDYLGPKYDYLEKIAELIRFVNTVLKHKNHKSLELAWALVFKAAYGRGSPYGSFKKADELFKFVLNENSYDYKFHINAAKILVAYENGEKFEYPDKLDESFLFCDEAKRAWSEAKSESVYPVLNFYLRRTIPFYLMKFIQVKKTCELPSGFTDYIFDWCRVMKNMNEKQLKLKEEFPERYKAMEEILEKIREEVSKREREEFYEKDVDEFSDGYSDLCCLSD